MIPRFVKFSRLWFESLIHLVAISSIFLALGVSVLAEDARESVLDRKVSLEKERIKDIPQVPRFCDTMKISKERVDIGGCALYCEREGKGTPIVLLHGGPGSTHHYFHPGFSRAAAFAQVIYYDQRGCGLSDYKPGDGYTVEQAVDDLENLRKALGLRKWIIVGHSYGGLLAQCYAVKYPDSVKGLVLVGAVPIDRYRGGTREADFMSQEEMFAIGDVKKDKNLSEAQNIYNSFLNGDWKRQCFYKPSRERIAQIALYEWNHDKNFNQIMSMDSGRINLSGAFDECPIPTLIMEGKWDLTWGADKAAMMEKSHPGSTLVMFERAGHEPFDDEPDKFFSSLKGFIETAKEPSAADVAKWKVQVAPPKDSLPAPVARTVEFPKDRSVGHYRLRDWGKIYWSDWYPIGYAKGTCAIPAGKEVMLVISEDDLSILATLPPDAIQGLSLQPPDKSKVTDEVLAPIAKWTALKELTLDGSAIGDRTLGYLKGKQTVKLIDASGTKITNVGLKNLDGLQNLWNLDIHDTAITDAAVETIRSLPALKELWLPKGITAAGLSAMQGSPLAKKMKPFVFQVIDKETGKPLPAVTIERHSNSTSMTDGLKQIVKTEDKGCIHTAVPYGEKSANIEFIVAQEGYTPASKSWKGEEMLTLPDEYTLKLEHAPGTAEPSQTNSLSATLHAPGWGRKSNNAIAKAYTKEGLAQLANTTDCIRAGFALYDAKRYNEALDAFKKMERISGNDKVNLGMAYVWQGHMLDLLAQRDEAVTVYKKALDLNVDGVLEHDQYGLKYNLRTYAKERMTKPFTRIENRDEN